MDVLFKALILGIVEGLTEFLPISSTGHLIIVGQLLDFNDEKGKLFEVVIQLGAILAVCWVFRARLIDTVRELNRSQPAQRFALNLFIAFLPAAVLGLLFIKQIKLYLFNPISVALALIAGGLLMLWIERRRHANRIEQVDDLRTSDALNIGLAQALALIPGVSRSGATIIGGLVFGLSRQAATEFSFFLAIPTMFAATLYDLYKHRHGLSAADLPMFGVGFVMAFISALLAVRGLLRYISRHDFSAFAWYRIGFGLLVLVTAYTGLVNWSESTESSNPARQEPVAQITAAKTAAGQLQVAPQQHELEVFAHLAGQGELLDFLRTPVLNDGIIGLQLGEQIQQPRAHQEVRLRSVA